MSSDVTAEQRRRMIAEAAYFLAQRRGFANGDATRDWLLAEAEIDLVLKAQSAHGLSISQQELEQLMARAREAQLELLAEALKIKLHEQGESGSAPLRAHGAHSHIAWEALSAALHSIIPEKK